MKTNRIIITPGEPAGIGPYLIVQLAQRSWPVEVVVCADPNLLQNRASLLGLPLTIIPYKESHNPIPQQATTLTLLPIHLQNSVVPGQLNVQNSYYVIETLLRASNGCLNNEFSALITGPVHKEIINKAGIQFTGHTEFLEKHSKISKAVMMLVTNKMRVALVTTHIPIKLVSDTITANLLREVIFILNHELQKKFRISNPHILVCGLNPHAGEGGYMGTEEVDTIIPVLKEISKKGIHLTGPLPADTIFQKKYIQNSDAIIAMYHDQGLTVLKYQGFGISVNVTLGLPYIRTSVDHGTALDLISQGKIADADTRSFVSAVNLAIKMIIN